jgi:predicted acetyltransferase
MSIQVNQVQTHDVAALSSMWQLYLFESSQREQLDVDSSGRFESPDELFNDVANARAGSSGYVMHCDGNLAGFLILVPAEIEGKQITEFADLFVLPRYRGRGVATAVIRQVVISSTQPWLIAVFRDDLSALGFWRRSFERLAFTSVREIIPPEVPRFHEFIVQESDAQPLVQAEHQRQATRLQPAWY